jgi:cytidyltransferase-like protein
VGHLEKFKMAKELCDYLIVGLVTDEGVVRYKKTTPFVPFEERKAMLEACRYVDEVVKIPPNFGGTREAWKMYGFDVQFSGSDYEDDPRWIADKEFLEEHGSTMVFFPYSEATSSSKLKELINRKLL